MTQVQANTPLFCSKLNEFRIEEKYCDVTIHVQEEYFKCHRLVLAATCEYFDAMFGGNFKESKSEDIHLGCNIDGLDAATFEEILRFAYTGKVIITAENAYNLIMVSEFLKLFSIEELCIKYIEQKIPIKNAIDIYVYACATMKESLKRVVSQYILTNFDTVSKTTKFLNIPYDDFFLLIKEYRDSTSSSQKKHSLLDTIMRWVHHAHQERTSYLDELFNLVDDFEDISPNYVKFMIKKYFVPGTVSSSIDVVDSTEYIPRNPLALHIFVELRNTSAVNERPHLNVFTLKDYKIKPFRSSEIASIICYEVNPAGSTRQPITNTFRSASSGSNLYSLNTGYYGQSQIRNDLISTRSINYGTAHKHPSPPVAVSSFELCTQRDDLYLYNRDILACHDVAPHPAFDNEELRRGIYVYKSEKEGWFPVAELKKPLIGACLAADDNRIYLVGGQSSSDESVSGYIQAYDSRTSQWLELPRGKISFINAACCMHERKLYVTGGDGGTNKETEVFDPVAGKWQQVKPMNYGRSLHQLISYKGRLWAIGSKNCELIFEVYNSVFDRWDADRQTLENFVTEEINELAPKTQTQPHVTAGNYCQNVGYGLYNSASYAQSTAGNYYHNSASYTQSTAGTWVKTFQDAVVFDTL